MQNTYFPIFFSLKSMGNINFPLAFRRSLIFRSIRDSEIWSPNLLGSIELWPICINLLRKTYSFRISFVLFGGFLDHFLTICGLIDSC